jgi:phospholipase C
MGATNGTVLIEYALPGDRDYQARLYPPVEEVKPEKDSPLFDNPPTTMAQIIEYFTRSSLDTDGIPFEPNTLKASQNDQGHWNVRFEVAPEVADNAWQFVTMHQTLMDENHAGQAMNGVDALKETPGAWNPMAGYPVNRSDGLCRWHLLLPLGMPMVNHKAVTLLHYPPHVAMRNLDYLHNKTLERWQRLLDAVGIPESEHSLYNNIVDVNPIAAPGSGQSEYNNDYFPIMMASSFFDAPSLNRNYIRAMLDSLLNPPHNEGNPYTLPLLIGGSPLYDPQAPGWFRVAFKDQMPKKKNGELKAEVLQAGFVQLHPDSKKTPYMIVNHMIAAAVTGHCSDNPDKIPDIRKYEAQDLVAAEFLRAYREKPKICPKEAKRQACEKWFGAKNGKRAPKPKDRECRRLLCILSKLDLYYNNTWEKAAEHCDKLAGADFDPCGEVLEDEQWVSQNSDYIISRHAGEETYQVWHFDPDSENLLQALPLDPGVKCNPDSELTCIGDYLLDWGPYHDTTPKGYPYRLLKFDPESLDPLAAEPVAEGTWKKTHFGKTIKDFANPEGAKKEFQKTNSLDLVPLDNFVLSIIPTAGRGTFKLWNFDPAYRPKGKEKPEILVKTNIHGAFETIQSGQKLISINGYVLQYSPKTGEYQLLHADVQSKMPLARPAIQSGRWETIGADHQLLAIGDYILDWVPEDRSYRLWLFDPRRKNPLVGPARSGLLPDGFSAQTTLASVQPRSAVREQSRNTPGTIDFMRDKIKHVVYYMLENRSFDHVCGSLYEEGEENVHFIGSQEAFKGIKTAPEEMPIYEGGKLSESYELEPLSFDPYHDNSDVMRQMFGKSTHGYRDRAKPDMKGFVWNNGTDEVMTALTPEQLPVLNGLAENFAISDEWFCSMPGATDVNRAFSLTGSSLGMLNNFQNGPEYTYWPQTPHRPSVFKTLWSNGITDWKIYNSIEWLDFVFTYHLFLDGQIPSIDNNRTDKGKPDPEHIDSIDNFLKAAEEGTLPAFSYLEPVWIAKNGTTSYHPGADLVPGERQLNKIYEALRKSPKWEETLLVITFDEHGGIYDHVPPPYAKNPFPNDEMDGFRFDVMGPRVPAILVSPWIRKHTVFRSETPVAYDATSFLSTLLTWFGIPRSRWGLGERTRHAPTFESVFQETTARDDAPLAFNPPYDKKFPPDAEPTEDIPLHDLHLTMAHRLITTELGEKIGAEKAQAVADEVLDKATNLSELHSLINDAIKKHGGTE